MAILTSDEINDICLSIVENIRTNHHQYYSRVLFMYYYGCRIGELFENRIYYLENTDKVYIIAQKNNNVRVCNLVNFEIPSLVENINLTNDNFWINKRNLQRIIEDAKPYRNLYCGNKKIGAHLFRHNWVKQQVNSGAQISTIDSNLGYTKQSIIDTYLPSIIRTTNI
jgi:site-specific recombinase XerD